MQPNVPLPLIFVADDNPTDVFFLRRRLHAAGITNPIHHVEDGMEAVRWFERLLAVQGSLPFLAIIDLKMPRMDGFEVLEWLRTHELTERLTVSVLSTSDEPTDVERALRLGAHKFLVKYPQPVQLIELASLAHRRTVADAPCNEPRLSGDS